MEYKEKASLLNAINAIVERSNAIRDCESMYYKQVMTQVIRTITAMPCYEALKVDVEAGEPEEQAVKNRKKKG